MSTTEFVTDLVNAAPEFTTPVQLISWETYPNGYSDTYSHGTYRSKAELLAAIPNDYQLVKHIWDKRRFYKKHGFR